MTPKTMLAIAASGTLLALSMPSPAQDTTTPAGDTTMQNPAPTPPEVPADPAPTEAPQPSTPPTTPAPPASPPPPTADDAMTTTTDTTMQPQPMQPAAPGTTPGMQDTNMTNPPPAPQAVYPRCSRTIVDQCQQSSARESDTKGGPPARRRRPR